MIFKDRPALRAFVVFGSLLAAAPAVVKVLSMNDTGRNVSIVLPDHWTTAHIKDGLEVKSADGEIFVWIQAAAPDNLKKMVDEYFAYYKKQGVTFTGGMNEQKGEIAGASVSIIEPPATYEGKPTIVRFIFADAKPGAQRGLVIGYWASPTGDKVHDGAVTQLMQDLLQN